jgi:3',5'-cyclic AMP phosphodiesterase CpdA
LAPSGLNRAKFLEILNKYNKSVKEAKTYYSFKKGNILFIALDGAIANSITARGLFSEDNIRFLNQQLTENKDIPAIIFQHFPIVYPTRSESHGVINKDEYLNTIDNYPNVKALFVGHFHISRICKRNNTLHVTSPALVQYPNAFRVVTLENTPDGLKFDIKTIETRLKEIQNKSLETTEDANLHAGKETDRNLQGILR